MLLTGENDYRTPIAETEQYYAALKMMKVETVTKGKMPHTIHCLSCDRSAKPHEVVLWKRRHGDVGKPDHLRREH